MTEPNPTREEPGIKEGMPPAAPSPGDAEPRPYQPVSGWAIAGLAVSGLYALMVVINGAVAFYQGAPFFYPDWVLLIPALGIALSLFGQRHVATSEGTRTGARLAVWGVRLSLVAGLVYLSYYFVTRYTLQSQANTFVMEMRDDAGFLKRLCKGADDPEGKELNYAFLLTQPPNTRKAAPDEKTMRLIYNSTNKEGGSGHLTLFKERETLPRILYKDLGKDAQITPLAVVDWRYEQRSYKIYRTYRIKTKELETDFILAVFSSEGESAGQGRKWFINLRESGYKSLVLTEYGEGIDRVRQNSREWLTKRVKAVVEGTPITNFDELDRTRWDLLVFDSKKVDVRQHQVQVRKFFAGTSELHFAVGFPNFEIFEGMDNSGKPVHQVGKWEQDAAGKIRMFPMFKFTLRKEAFKLPVYQYEAVATLETKQSIDPLKFNPDTPIDWNLISIDVTAVHAIFEDAKGLPAQGTPPPR